MATTTPTKRTTKPKPTTPEGNELLLAVTSFVEGIEADSRRYFADTVERYETVAAVLQPHYAERDKAWKAEQTKRGTAADKLTDYPVSKWHAVLTSEYGDRFKMTEANLRDVKGFWKLHSAENYAGYLDALTTDRKHGSWSGYLAHCADVARDYITSDGKETGKRPKRAGSGLSADDVAPLTTTNFIAEVEAPNDIERMITAGKQLHDFTWQYAEAMAKLNDDAQKVVRKAIKDAINIAKG